MDTISAKIVRFIEEEDGSGDTEYGNLYLVAAVALFIIFAAFQGGMMSTVQNVAGDFVNKLDSLSVADSGRTTL
jgi:Flp pilus assembly pilin Flp